MWVCSRLINLALCALDAYRIFIYKSSIYHSYMLDTTPSGVCVYEYMYIWGSPGLFALWQPLTQGLTKLRKISCMCMLCTAVCGCVRVSEIISHTHTGRKQQQQQGHLAWGIGVDFSMIFNILRKIFVARRIFGRRWDYVTCLGSNSDRQRRRQQRCERDKATACRIAQMAKTIFPGQNSHYTYSCHFNFVALCWFSHANKSK